MNGSRGRFSQRKRVSDVTIKVDMGKAIFESKKVPVNCEKEECIGETLELEYRGYEINCVSVGNPHCVVLKDELDEKEIKTFGPQIETNPMFPNRINVQFAVRVSLRSTM